MKTWIRTIEKHQKNQLRGNLEKLGNDRWRVWTKLWSILQGTWEDVGSKVGSKGTGKEISKLSSVFPIFLLVALHFLPMILPSFFPNPLKWALQFLPKIVECRGTIWARAKGCHELGDNFFRFGSFSKFFISWVHTLPSEFAIPTFWPRRHQIGSRDCHEIDRFKDLIKLEDF